MGVPFPTPGVLQTLRNGVRVARVERARMVCRVWCVRALDGRLSVLVWHNSSWPIVCVVLHEVRVARVWARRRITQCGCYPHCSERWFASVCLWGGGAPWHLVCSWLCWPAGMRVLIRHACERVITVISVILGVRCLGIIGFSNMTLVLTKCHICHIGGCSWCVWWCGCPDSTWCEKCLIGDDSWHVGRHVSVVS